MKTLQDQLAEYGQIQDDVFGTISLDEVTDQTVAVEGRTGRHPVLGRHPTALAIAAMVAVLVVIGGIAFLMGGSNEVEPVDIPTTIVPLPEALRQNGEVITYGRNDAYFGDIDYLGDLLAQDPDTGEVRTLVDAKAMGIHRPAWAAWSADGRWAAFEFSGCVEGNEVVGAGLWVTNGVDEPRQLTKPCTEDGPANIHEEFWEWSPTGAQLVVARQFSDGDALILIDPATGDRTDLGKTAGDITSLAWSPDGTRIAYGAVPTGSPDGNSEEASIHSVSVDGGAHTRLASSLGGSVPGGEEGSGIRWSPDGARIAVLAQAEDNRLYLMDADGSDLELAVTEGGLVINHVMGSPNLMWSPDGTRMAYATYSEGGDTLQIWNVSPAGSTPILVFDSAPTPVGNFLVGGPVWSPDGEEIAFRFQNGWLVTNADGTGDAREIDQLQYLSWRGGWYFCECYG